MEKKMKNISSRLGESPSNLGGRATIQKCKQQANTIIKQRQSGKNICDWRVTEAQILYERAIRKETANWLKKNRQDTWMDSWRNENGICGEKKNLAGLTGILWKAAISRLAWLLGTWIFGNVPPTLTDNSGWLCLNCVNNTICAKHLLSFWESGMLIHVGRGCLCDWSPVTS